MTDLVCPNCNFIYGKNTMVVHMRNAHSVEMCDPDELTIRGNVTPDRVNGQPAGEWFPKKRPTP